MIAWRALADTRSLRITVPMITSRIRDTWVRSELCECGVEFETNAAGADKPEYGRFANVRYPSGTPKYRRRLAVPAA